MSIFNDPNFLDGMRDLGRGPWAVSNMDSSPIASVPQTVQVPDIGIGDISALSDAGKGGGLFSGFGMDEAKLAMGGLQTIGQLWGAIQSAKLAKKSFKWNREMGEANMANQISAFNEALDGKRRTRQVVEGQSDAQSQAYYDRFKATRNPRG